MGRFKYGVFLIVMFIGISLTACKNETETLTIEQANEIVTAYFQGTDLKEVEIVEIGRERIGQDIFLNTIYVAYGGIEYTLILDENNVPLADNVEALKLLSQFDVSSVDEDVRSLGATLNYDVLQVIFSPLDSQYKVLLHLNLNKKPCSDCVDIAYGLFETVKRKGIDQLVLSITTPNFLLSNGTRGIQLDSEMFSSSLDKDEFYSKFLDFSNNIIWDEEKFADVELKLGEIGCSDIQFSILGVTVDTIRIELSFKKDSHVSNEQLESIYADLDDSIFQIGNKKTEFIICQED